MQVALCFLVRHAAHHNAIWRAWLASAAGLLPASAVHAACCAASDQRKPRRFPLQEVRDRRHAPAVKRATSGRPAAADEPQLLAQPAVMTRA